MGKAKREEMGLKKNGTNGTNGDDKDDCNPRWFRGKRKIMKYCKIGEEVFVRWIAIGMPVVILDGSYRAHADNLDHFLRYISKSGDKVYDPDAD